MELAVDGIMNLIHEALRDKGIDNELCPGDPSDVIYIDRENNKTICISAIECER